MTKFDLTLTPSQARGAAHNFAFGCKVADVVATLEDMVARLKAGELTPQEMTLTNHATVADFAMKTLSVKVAEPESA